MGGLCLTLWHSGGVCVYVCVCVGGGGGGHQFLTNMEVKFPVWWGMGIFWNHTIKLNLFSNKLYNINLVLTNFKIK